MIDAHLHVNYKGLTASKIKKYLDKNAIDRCWLLTWEEHTTNNKEYLNLSINEVFEAYQKYPDRVIPLYAPDPNDEHCMQKLHNWNEQGVKGFGEAKFPLNFNSEKMRSLLAELEKKQTPFVFHMEEPGVYFINFEDGNLAEKFFLKIFQHNALFGIPRKVLEKFWRGCSEMKKKITFELPGYMLDFAGLELVLADFPGISFIAHGPMFWKYISSDAPRCNEKFPRHPIEKEGLICSLLRDYPNLFADISAYSGFNALNRSVGFSKRFLSEFSHKILYGTDNFMFGQKEFLNSLNLSPQTYARIYHDNAERIMS